MREEPHIDWQSHSTPQDDPRVATDAEATSRATPARSSSALAVTLTAVAAGLAVFVTAFSPTLGAVSGRGLAWRPATVALAEGPQRVQAGGFVAGDEDQVPVGTPTLAASQAQGGTPIAVATAEPTDVATGAPGAEDELIAEERAQLSNRSGSRADAALPEPVAAEAPDAVAVSEKLDDARLQSAKELASLSTETGKEGAAISASTAVQATPKPVVKAPTPKPVVKAAVRRVVSATKPVVKAPAPKPVTSTISDLGQRVVSIALRYVGYRYAYGGISPSTGFDCSGFTYYVYGRAGRPIPRSLSGQYGTGRAIARSALQPGDLIFFQGTNGPGLSHAAIYIGGGRFVNAQSERVGVATASLGTTYWSSHYLGARRP